jgi:hypothetical protein
VSKCTGFLEHKINSGKTCPAVFRELIEPALPSVFAKCTRLKIMTGILCFIVPF